MAMMHQYWSSPLPIKSGADQYQVPPVILGTSAIASPAHKSQGTIKVVKKRVLADFKVEGQILLRQWGSSDYF